MVFPADPDRMLFKHPDPAFPESHLPPEFSVVNLGTRPAEAGGGLLSWAFCSLQHIPNAEIHLARVCLARYVPSSRFGYLPGGLLPPRPGQPLFQTDSAPGIHPSELPPPERYPRRCRPGCTHLLFLLPLLPWITPWAGLASRSFWALTLSGVPRCPNAVNVRNSRLLPWVFAGPFRAHYRGTCLLGSSLALGIIDGRSRRLPGASEFRHPPASAASLARCRARQNQRRPIRVP